jgi:hypothetical protein
MYTLLFSWILTQSAFAHQPQEGRVLGTFGPYIYQTEITHDDADYDSPILGGYGLIVEGGVDKRGGVEIALFYLHKVYIRTAGTNTIAEKMKRMAINIGYRHWFNESFSFGGSYYSSYSMGDPTLIHSDFTGIAPQTTAHRTAETGFDFSLQWEFYRKQDWMLIADARYSVSFNNRSGEDADIIGLLIGYKQPIQTHRSTREEEQ